MELVNITNTHSSRPLTLRHAKGDITIAPAETRVVPLDHALVAFGHPSAVNDGANKARDAEYAQTRTFWGFYPGIHAEEEWEDLRPRFTASTLDGEPVTFLVDDPDGTAGNPGILVASNTTLAADQATLLARIAEMEQNQAQLVAQLSALTSLPAGDPDAAPVPASTATTPTDAKVSPEVQVAADAAAETQEERNEAREELPKPRSARTSKDAPTTPRTGRRG